MKGIRFFGTPFFGVGQANLSVPLVRPVQGPNMFIATIGKYLGSLKETYQTDDQSIEVFTFLQRFISIVNEKNMVLLISCEEFPVVGSEFVWLLHPCPGAYGYYCSQPVNMGHK